ncbi:MAG: hypothetical protein LAQ30_21700 [Acidobacteriia bacterium]|nr:hypothetical protein [Terriglobia bacterium]
MKPSPLLLVLAVCGAASAAAPSYTSAGIVNASNYAPGPFAPNSALSIFGAGLAWSTQSLTPADIQGGLLPTSLNGVQVFVSGWPAPLFYVSELQINFLMPTNQIAGNATVRVVRQGVSGPEVPVSIVDAAPGLFDSPAAPGYAVAQLWPDYSLVSPDAPAAGGDVIMLYATGLGRTTPYPSRPDEIPAFAGAMERIEELRVYLDGVPLERPNVLWAGISPGSAGLYQVNLKLPEGIGPDPEIRVSVGEQITPPGLKLALTYAVRVERGLKPTTAR